MSRTSKLARCLMICLLTAGVLAILPVSTAHAVVVECWPDADQDGYGQAGAGPFIPGDGTCDTVQQESENDLDCDDSDASVYPGAVEFCDGQSNTCDFSVPSDETDDDLDGYVECVWDAGSWHGDAGVIGGSDCNDSDADMFPDNAEVCDLKDNDCDFQIDEQGVCVDTDGDGLDDIIDTDDDNDGVPDHEDSDPLNPDICKDQDFDGCDDCSIGVDDYGPDSDNNPFNDGPDADADGICDSGDPNPNNATPPVMTIESGYIQLDTYGEAPPFLHCVDITHQGRMVIDSVNGLIYICTESGWIAK